MSEIVEYEREKKRKRQEQEQEHTRKTNLKVGEKEKYPKREFGERREKGEVRATAARPSGRE